MHAVDGPQVEVGVERPEDASGQVVTGLRRGRAALAWWCRSPGILLVIATARDAGGRGTEAFGAMTAFRCRQLIERVEQVAQYVAGEDGPAVARRYPGLPVAETGVLRDHHPRVLRAEPRQPEQLRQGFRVPHDVLPAGQVRRTVPGLRAGGPA
jgi:hypothetical protein